MKKKAQIMQFMDGRYLDIRQQVRMEQEYDMQIILAILVSGEVTMLGYLAKTFLF